MGANRSTAVMQRRRTAPDSLDYFPTPPFATRALMEFLTDQCGDLSAFAAWEPACGELHMAKPMREQFASVRASDVWRYGEHELLDFAMFGANEPACDFVISNPPFKLAEEFVRVALKVARRGVCMLVRSAFLEGQDRYRDLYSQTKPSFVLQFVERVAMLEGRLVKRGKVDPFAEKEGTKVSSATAYCWLVWLADDGGSYAVDDTRFRWIAPCCDRLEQAGDYPDYAKTSDEPLGGLFEAA